jgi:hypothetical protein
LSVARDCRKEKIKTAANKKAMTISMGTKPCSSSPQEPKNEMVTIALSFLLVLILRSHLYQHLLQHFIFSSSYLCKLLLIHDFLRPAAERSIKNPGFSGDCILSREYIHPLAGVQKQDGILEHQFNERL